MTTDIDVNLILSKLCPIAEMGFIRPVSTGSNSIGKTLQSLLGIPHTVRQRNKLHNFTITSTTTISRKTNLFACTPDWSTGPIKSSTDFAQKFGVPDPKRGYEKSLFCTVDAIRPNKTFFLQLFLDKHSKILSECRLSNDNTIETLFSWDKKKLAKKMTLFGNHAIVTAIKSTTNAGFHYRYIDFLINPLHDRFYDLLEDGLITIDHLISLKRGEKSAQEKGPLFKIQKDAYLSLFAQHLRYDLLD